LDKRDDVEVLVKINSRPRGLARVALLLVTFRPTRQWWWSNMNLGPINIMLRSYRRDRVLKKVSGGIDLVLHVRNIYLPARTPYVAFIDSTSRMANRSWSGWRPTAMTRRLRYLAERRYYRGAQVVLTAGAQAAESVVSEYGLDASRVRAIGGGVNFDPLPMRLAVWDEPTIIWVGLDWERKGGDLLLQAFEQLRQEFPDAKLLMVGAGERDRQENVEFLPPIYDRDQLAELYRRASVFAHPARHEPYGLVVQEAMAFGLPCVVSDVGALPSIVSDGESGYVVPVGDTQALVHAVATLLRDRRTRVQLGSRGRARVESEFTWTAVAARMVDAVTDAHKEERLS
jgi:glycosyltransferase involved in cell wall biosynthesis